MSNPAPTDFRQHLELETPEHVMLDLEIAGIGSRVLAALMDWLIVGTLVTVCFVAFAWVASSARWVLAAGIALSFGITYGYFTLFEAFRGGQTPGKRQLDIRVIRDTGHGVTLAEAAVRNLLLPIDLIGMVGVVLIAVTPRARRLGDMVAGTVVVRDRPVQVASVIEVADTTTPPRTEAVTGTPVLADADAHLLRAFLDRAPDLPDAARDRLAGELATRFHEVLSTSRGGDAITRLRRLHDDEQARRQGRFGSRGAARHAGAAPAVAERLVARQSARWETFQVMADRVTRGGLASLTPAELPEFAERYREVAADLARARTYKADPMVLLRLERMVAAGHNALYRVDRRTWRRIATFLALEAPAAVVANRRVVLLAFISFLLPAIAGFALLRERPQLAPELIPDTMLERIEAGPARTEAGLGYYVAETTERPVVAISIITNNLRVAMTAFASGILFGVGSLAALAFNGLSLGAISGAFANAGMLGYLWTFVVGHGVLELFAIWVAGAAGFLLGGALFRPGEYSRSDAMVLAGRTALRLVAASGVLLLVAGLIEGFISASNWPLAARAAVSVASALLLVAYLGVGARWTMHDAR
ncbi:MAG TPA: stage II sporulation protein M [Gemmatimonadales bacterium]|nr:stage II sporulation protein M [Gemmatimonadales bacterium]